MYAEDQPGLFQDANRTEQLGSDGSNGHDSPVKNYVLDTNVLLHDPHSVYRFADNHVWIPIDVLSELDKFKNEQTERGANARAVHRFLTRCFNQDSRLVTRGAKTPGGGTIRIAVNEYLSSLRTNKGFRRFQQTFRDLEKPDHRILGLCLYVKGRSPERTVLVTKDLNMQLKALAIGLEAQDYENDKVEVTDVEGYGQTTIVIDPHQLQRFASSGELTLKDGPALDVNEYVFLASEGAKVLPARHLGGGTCRRLALPAALVNPRGVHLKPINLGQQCLLDALLDPNISLVTCYGQAGTGKTLLAVAAGLHLYWSRAFSGLTVSRPVVAMGDTLGFLPGNLDEKMRPWLQSIYDAFELLLPVQNLPEQAKKVRRSKAPGPLSPGPGTGPGLKPYEQLIEQGCVEIEALCYIRGRSIPNRYFVLDEAQQLTPLEAKTVVTRMSKGSKLVMVGDPAQIDNPYVDSRSNGLVYTRGRLKGQSITAHVCLTKGERSALAEVGANLM
ncbi:MAG TPA: PhoH family protein [Chthoniobacterales bacterium]